MATVATRISSVRLGLPLLSSWRNSGAWVHLQRVLYEQGRHHAGPGGRSIGGDHGWPIDRDDSSVVALGFDAHKRLKGRKRNILVDTLGLLVANRV